MAGCGTAGPICRRLKRRVGVSGNNSRRNQGYDFRYDRAEKSGGAVVVS